MVMSLLDASFQEQIKLFIKSIPIKIIKKIHSNNIRSI